MGDKITKKNAGINENQAEMNEETEIEPQID